MCILHAERNCYYFATRTLWSSHCSATPSAATQCVPRDRENESFRNCDHGLEEKPLLSDLIRRGCSTRGPPNIGGEVTPGGGEKCSDAKICGPGKNVRTRTNLPTKGQNLFGHGLENSDFFWPAIAGRPHISRHILRCHHFHPFTRENPRTAHTWATIRVFIA
jgi:hypothetical protein